MVPERGADGSVETVLAIARDVTDHRRSELALRVSEARLKQGQDKFETLADALPAVIKCYDRQLKITFANAAAERAAGVSRAEMTGRTDSELGFPPELAERWQRSLRRVLETGEPYIRESRLAPDERRRYEVIGIPLMQKGAVEGIISVASDVTQRARAEEDRLSQMSRQRATLVTEVHHRVKNNLQGVVGVLSQFGRLHVELAPLLDKAVSLLHAMGIVHDLQGREMRDAVVLDGLVAEVSKSAERATGATVSYKFGPLESARVYVREQDAVAVAVTLHELVVNACKHGSSDSGGPAVKVVVVIDKLSARIAIVNRGSLPAGFDFKTGRTLSTGLDLVKALLPLDGAQLAFSADDREVLAVLNLDPPVLVGAAEAAKEIPHEWNRRKSSSSDRRR